MDIPQIGHKKWRNHPSAVYSLEDDEMEVYLGKPPKTISSDAYVNGRFELYPTSNNWTFILLDQIDGDVYHVQWNQKRDSRMIIEIKYVPLK